MLEYFDGTEALCVSFEPNPKKPAVFTADKSVLLNKKDEIVAQFKETLKSDVTLYKDAKSGLYKEKIGKVYVLQRKRGLAGLGANNKDAFKTIGEKRRGSADYASVLLLVQCVVAAYFPVTMS